MAIEVRKKEGETASNLIRRFARRVQQSGILLRARKIRFYESSRTKRERKLSALRRKEMEKEREKLSKLGIEDVEIFSKKKK